MKGYIHISIVKVMAKMMVLLHNTRPSQIDYNRLLKILRCLVCPY